MHYHPLSHRLHVCHICLHWCGLRGQCRHLWQSHGSCLGIDISPCATYLLYLVVLFTCCVVTGLAPRCSSPDLAPLAGASPSEEPLLGAVRRVEGLAQQRRPEGRKEGGPRPVAVEPRRDPPTRRPKELQTHGGMTPWWDETMVRCLQETMSVDHFLWRVCWRRLFLACQPGPFWCQTFLQWKSW